MRPHALVRNNSSGVSPDSLKRNDSSSGSTHSLYFSFLLFIPSSSFLISILILILLYLGNSPLANRRPIGKSPMASSEDTKPTFNRSHSEFVPPKLEESFSAPNTLKPTRGGLPPVRGGGTPSGRGGPPPPLPPPLPPLSAPHSATSSPQPPPLPPPPSSLPPPLQMNPNHRVSMNAAVLSTFFIFSKLLSFIILLIVFCCADTQSNLLLHSSSDPSLLPPPPKAKAFPPKPIREVNSGPVIPARPALTRSTELRFQFHFFFGVSFFSYVL